MSNHNKWLLAALALLSLLSGCASLDGMTQSYDKNSPTEEAYRKRLDPWIGQSFKTYSEYMGQPQMSYAHEDMFGDYSEIHTYIYKGSVIDSKTHEKVDLVCQVDFKTDKKDIIQSYKLKGNDCVAFDNQEKK